MKKNKQTKNNQELDILKHESEFLFGLSDKKILGLFNGTSTFFGYLMPRPSFNKNSSSTV